MLFIAAHIIYVLVGIKKSFPILSLLIIFLFLPAVAFADLSCCSANGGAYACDYSTSKLYCKDGTVSTECTCHAVPTPTLTPIPTVGPTFTPVPSPSCPTLSSYDSSSKVCKCNNGYLVSGNACVSYAQYCWTNYGGNSFYDSDKDSCNCASGYTWNSTRTSCISWEQLCHNVIGSKSYYNNDNKSCVCYEGYALQNNECKPIPTQTVPTPQQSTEVIVTPPANPTVASVKMTTPAPKKTPPTPTSILKGLKQNDYISVKKPQKNQLVEFFENIWHFILKLF